MESEDLLKLLSDKTLPTKLGEKSIDKMLFDVPVNGDKLQFSLGVESKAEVFLFNDSNDFDDKNPDEILGPGSLVAFTPANAWLKYSALAGIKTESGLKVDQLGFTFGGKSSITTTNYRKHDPAESLSTAFLTDATTFKSIFSASQIKLLSPGEAVTFSLSGELFASVKVTWSDLFSANLSILGQLLNQNELFKIKIGAEASASYRLKISDDFTVKIVCKSSNVFGVYIAKSKTTDQLGSIGLKVQAEFENKKEIEKVLTNLIEGYFGEAEELIQRIVSKAESLLTKEEKDILSLIAERLGWIGEASLPYRLKTEYQNLKDKVTEKIEELAALKVSAGFKYDYNRISTQSILFQAETDGTGIDRFHLDILKTNANALINSFRKGEAILKNVEFVRSNVLTITNSTGFSIGFGKWTAGSDKKTEIKKIELEDQSGHKKISYAGNRIYSEEVFGDGVKWKIDLNAEMVAFSQNAIPYANEFDYGLYVAHEWKEKTLELNESLHFTDLAAIWGIIPESQIEEEGQNIYKALSGIKENIRLSCEIKIAAGAFEPMLPALTRICKNQDVLAFALGKSMPRWGDYKTRKDITSRAKWYGELWKAYLSEQENPDPNTQLYADAAYRKLRTSDKTLAEAEMNYKDGVFKPYSFGSIINNNPGTFYRSKQLAEGFSELLKGNDARSTLVYNKVIPKAFDLVEDFWRKPHHLKTLGTLLAMTIESYPTLRQFVERSASIRYTNSKGKEMVMIIGKQEIQNLQAS